MPQITVSKRIAAPPAAVFAIVTDLDNIPSVVPDIKKIERLTPGAVGVGTRFKETRVMFGREATETMEIVEFVPGVRYATTANSSGNWYRCEHRFHADGTGTILELEFNATAQRFFAKLMSPLFWMLKGMMKKLFLKDLDAVARAAEQSPTPAAQAA